MFIRWWMTELNTCCKLFMGITMHRCIDLHCNVVIPTRCVEYYLLHIPGLIWEPLVSGFFLSAPHIENYLSNRPCSSISALSTASAAIQQWKIDLKQSHAKQYLLASALKIGLMFGFAFALVDGLAAPHTVFVTLSTTYPGKCLLLLLFIFKGSQMLFRWLGIRTGVMTELFPV